MDSNPDRFCQSGFFFATPWLAIIVGPGITMTSRPTQPRAPRSTPAPLDPSDYLKKILTARVYDVAVESALEPARTAVATVCLLRDA